MEIEFRRKLIELENSVKDIDERLAELYRETAGLSLQKSAVMRKISRNIAISKKYADEVKKIHFELKGRLDDVSRKLARMDEVVAKLNSMRKAARKEKSKEFAELAAAVLQLNKKISKISKLLNDMRAEPQLDALQKEVLKLKNIISKPSKVASVNLEAALARLENIIDQKIDSGQLRDALGDVSGALSSEIELLQKKFFESLKDLELKLEETRKRTYSESEKIENLVSKQSELSRSLTNLIKRLKDFEIKLSKISKGAKAGVASPNAENFERLDKKIETIRKRANSILKEIYDSIDEIKSFNVNFQNQVAQNLRELNEIKMKIKLLEDKLESVPCGTGEELDVSGLIAEVEELREYVNTLAKGLDISKALAQELKTTQAKLAAIESWKARAEDVPRELEKLAERLTEVESVKSLEGDFAQRKDLERLAAQLNSEIGALRAKAENEVKSLKVTIAELMNKLRLINTLALENQKLEHRLFVLEDMVDASEIKKKVFELEKRVKELQPKDGLHARISDLQAKLEEIRPVVFEVGEVKRRLKLLEDVFDSKPIQNRMENLEKEIKILSEKVNERLSAK